MEKGTGMSCVRGQGAVHSITLAKGAIHTEPPVQKLFHCHPGMARKAGHVSQCEHGAGQREGQQVPTAPWTVKLCLIPLTAATLPLSPSLTLEISVLPCTSKHKSRFAWGALQKCRGMSSPRNWPCHPPCVKPHPKCWCEP